MSKQKEERIGMIKDEIERLENELSITTNWMDRIKGKRRFADEDKIRIFDEFHDEAVDYLKTYAETGYEPKDGDLYIYESVMTKCLGSGVFDIINAI